MAEDEQGKQIHIGGYSFDPLAEAAEDRAALSRDVAQAEEDQRATIVQFQRPLAREERFQLLGEHRLKLDDYLPADAFVETIAPETLQRLERHPLFRASVPLRPAFKISPDLGQRKYRSDARQALAGLWLNVVFLHDTEPKAAAEALSAAGAQRITVHDDRPLGGVLHANAVVEDEAAVSALARMPDVRWIEEVPEHVEDNVAAAGTLQSGAAANPAIWNQGLHGEGQVIGIIDGGQLDINHCFFQDPTNNTPRPAHRKVLQIRNAGGDAAGRHATFTSGCAAGDDFNLPGTAPFRGGAWAARLTSGNNNDIPGTVSMLQDLNAAAEAGAFIHSNSWHDDTAGSGNPATYNQTAADVDSFTWNNEDHLVLGSAGNVGEEQGPPGTAKNAICVGATQADPNEMNFGDGNPGPTADGRRKPDIMAPGCAIQSATVNTACGSGPWPGGGVTCATSFATPHMAAGAALVRQYFTEGFYPSGTAEPHHSFIPSGALLKAVLVASAIDMTGIAGYPSIQEGWGLVQLANGLFFPGSARNLRVWDQRNAGGLFTGDVREHHIDVASNTQPLRVALVWTDPPATAGSASPAINNLDLEVVSPDGTQTFLGNVFAAGVSTTGGAADAINNVEVVLINAPAVGDWTVRVRATAVNVGNPGQGYAIAVTADMTEPPAAIGAQDVLVVRVKFNDIAFEPPLPNLQNLMTEVATYVQEVSYGQASVVPAYRGALLLDHNKDYYYHPDRSLLIELAQEVVAKLFAAEPAIFDTIERMMIVTNDVNFTGDVSTTGPWPYDLPAGFTRPISVSVQSYASPAARFNHALLHHFGLVDLYAHEGVTFPRPYVDEWDNMAGLYNNVHPLIWSKRRAGWLAAHGDTIEYIARPASGSSYAGPNPIQLFRNTSSAINRKAIALGLSEGAGTIDAERAFYYVEARNNAAGTFDSALPGSGVLVYYVNELIPQGEGPVILRDKNLLTQGLGDAFFGVGDAIDIPGTGITLTVLAGTGAADFNIQIAYTPPVTDYNVFITRGDTIDGRFYSYFSPDIWIDSPRNGFDLGGGPPPHDQRDNPVAGQINRIYARIHNDGPGTAFDFDVRFRISEPYHTVGGEADFDHFVGIKHISALPMGQTDVFVEWTPVSAGQPHACVMVDLINLVGTDTNPNDNWAQENLHIVATVQGSPYAPVAFRYNLTNPYDYEALFYFRHEGAPDDWEVELTPRKIRLAPGERMNGEIVVRAPEEARPCTSERIEVTSWTPRGDTLIPVGGAVVQVDLRRPTAIRLDAEAVPCSDEDIRRLMKEREAARRRADPPNVQVERSVWKWLRNLIGRLLFGRKRDTNYATAATHGFDKDLQADAATIRKRCGRMVVHGCMEPPMAGVEVILKYVDATGAVTYRTVKTDENGCFDDFFVSVTGGTWQVTAEFRGERCEAPVVEGPLTVCWCR